MLHALWKRCTPPSDQSDLSIDPRCGIINNKQLKTKITGYKNFSSCLQFERLSCQKSALLLFFLAVAYLQTAKMFPVWIDTVLMRRSYQYQFSFGKYQNHALTGSATTSAACWRCSLRYNNYSTVDMVTCVACAVSISFTLQPEMKALQVKAG